MLGRPAGVLAAGAAAVLLLPLLIIMLLLGSAGSGTAASAAGSAQDAAVMTGPLPPGAAGTAIAFAQAQLGKPYLYGGTGPDAFDCSGLVMMAYQSAGVTIPRTSEVQYAQLPHVSPADVKPGDLVFFAGGDGTATSPGHVGLVVDPARRLMIDAYETGVPIRYDTYGPGAMPGSGLSPVVGFARP